jgi:hypothetical protein
VNNPHETNWESVVRAFARLRFSLGAECECGIEHSGQGALSVFVIDHDVSSRRGHEGPRVYRVPVRLRAGATDDYNVDLLMRAMTSCAEKLGVTLTVRRRGWWAVLQNMEAAKALAALPVDRVQAGVRRGPYMGKQIIHREGESQSLGWGTHARAMPYSRALHDD